MSDTAEWESRITMSHAQQVSEYGWCICEGTNEEGHLAEDCPRKEVK